jgi:curved DNA-binding protein CbpA
LTGFPEDPRDVLGVAAEAGEEEIRAAYLRKIKEYPPERAPAEFERVRDAYGLLRDPRRRAERLLFGGEAMAPLQNLLDGRRAARRFTGPKPWLAALKEK